MACSMVGPLTGRRWSGSHRICSVSIAVGPMLAKVALASGDIGRILANVVRRRLRPPASNVARHIGAHGRRMICALLCGSPALIPCHPGAAAGPPEWVCMPWGSVPSSDGTLLGAARMGRDDCLVGVARGTCAQLCVRGAARASSAGGTGRVPTCRRHVDDRPPCAQRGAVGLPRLAPAVACDRPAFASTQAPRAWAHEEWQGLSTFLF